MLRLCLDFPALGREALDVDTATAVLGAHGSHRWLIAEVAGDEQGKVLPAGMALADARARRPELLTLPRRPEAELEQLHALAHAFYRFGSPVVVEVREQAEPYAIPRWQLFVEIGASLSLFGGLAALLETVLIELLDWNVQVRYAIAPTRAGASSMAVCGRVAPCFDLPALRPCLAALPIDALPWPASQRAAMVSVGFHTLGHLFGLPRAHLLQRLGGAAVHGIEQLLGERAEPFTAIEPPQVFAARHEFVGEIDNVETLLFPLKRMTQRFAAYLSARAMTAQRCTLELRHDLGRPTVMPLALLSPSHDAARWFESLRERLYRTPPDCAVRELHLSACDFLPQNGTQTALFDAHAVSRERQATLEKLIARYGEKSMWQLGMAGDHRPEKAWHATPPVTTELPTAFVSRAGGKLPRRLRPLWLLPQPQPIERQIPEDLPERIETGWWDGAPARRD